MRTALVTLAAAVICSTTIAFAQTPAQRPMSPAGTAATQVGGKWVDASGRSRYEGGKWIEISYGRPVKRGRQNLFGTGADYGKAMNADAPVWRAGANKSTRLTTEVPLMIGDKKLPAGEYSLFIDLKGPTDWTLILSTHTAQDTYNKEEKVALWGAYNYTPDKDVLRVPMKVESLPYSMDQLTYAFTDVTGDAGMLRIMWDTTMASVPFKVAQ